MNTFELTDELLTRALRVDDQPVPPTLRATVIAAVADARRPRILSLPTWRPALSFAAATALLAVALILGAFYVGSRTPAPLPSALPTTLLAASPTAVPIVIAFQSPLWAYSIEFPSTWQVTAGLEIPKCCQQPDKFEGDGTVISIDSVGELSDCSVDFALCGVSACSPGGQACPTAIGQPVTPAQEEQWLTASLGQVLVDCPDRPVEVGIAVGAHFGRQLVFDCPGLPSPTTEIRVVAAGRGYEIRVAGSPDSQLLTHMLESIAFSEAGPAPTPSPAPESMQRPTPLTTAGPEVAPTSFAEFSAHVGESVAAYRPASQAWYLFVTTLDGGGGNTFQEQWQPLEISWIFNHRPDPCYELRFSAWVDAVGDVTWASTHARRSGQLLGVSDEFKAAWPGISSAVSAFDPDIGRVGCEPSSFTDFSAHIVQALAGFASSSTALDKYGTGDFANLSDALAGGKAVRIQPRSWLEEQRLWLDTHLVDDCYAQAASDWRALLNGFGDFISPLPPAGFRTDSTTWSQWTGLRDAIVGFDPTVGSDCGSALSFPEWTAHVDAVLATFGPMSQERNQQIQQAGPLSQFDFKPEYWIPEEPAWLEGRSPDECFAERFTTWSTLVEAFRSSYHAFGLGPSDEKAAALTSWNNARSSIAAFDPRSGTTC